MYKLLYKYTYCLSINEFCTQCSVLSCAVLSALLHTQKADTFLRRWCNNASLELSFALSSQLRDAIRATRSRRQEPRPFVLMGWIAALCTTTISYEWSGQSSCKPIECSRCSAGSLLVRVGTTTTSPTCCRPCGRSGRCAA